MKKPEVNKSQLFKLAWKLYKKKVYATFSDCLKQAWKIARFVPDFNTEFRNIQKDLFAFAMSLCKNIENANDLVQEASIKIFNGFHLFDPEKANKGFKGWAITVMQNHFYDVCRSNGTRNKYMTMVDVQETENENNTFRVENVSSTLDYNSDDRTNKNELKGLINSAIGKIKHKTYQKAIRLRMDGYTYKEISDMLQIPLNTVRAYIFRARDILSENVQIREYLTV